RREFYRLMLDDTDRLLATVEQVLKAGQAGHKKQRDRVTVDFGQLVRECVDVARASHQLDQEALRLEQLPEAEPTVLADSEELRTAVSNVLDNAVKYSNGRVDVSVRVETPDEKHVTLRVKDQGVGIAPHDLKRVFKRFYRVPNRVLSNVKGTGLGLFIVRALQLLLGHDGKRENFDAVVLDIMLPGKDGFAVASELRAAKNFVPVLMLTARGRPEDVLNGFASGADDYLPKPFELPILLAR